LRFHYAQKFLIYRQFLREKDFLTSSIFELTRTLIFWSGYPVEILSGLNWVGQRGWKNGSSKVLRFKIFSWKDFLKLKSFTEFISCVFMQKIPISTDFSNLIENFPTLATVPSRVTVLQFNFSTSARAFSLW